MATKSATKIASAGTGLVFNFVVAVFFPKFASEVCDPKIEVCDLQFEDCDPSQSSKNSRTGLPPQTPGYR